MEFPIIREYVTMGEFCTKHGDGQVWFKNAANYANDLMADLNRRNYIKDFFTSTIESGVTTIGRLETIYQKKKVLPERLIRQMVSTASVEHFGQVVTIFHFSPSITGPDVTSAQSVVPVLLLQAASRPAVPAMPAVFTNFLLSIVLSPCGSTGVKPV